MEGPLSYDGGVEEPNGAKQPEQGPSEARFDISVPGDLETGVYANFLAVWHSAHDFTLDFAVTGQAQEQGDGTVHVPTRVVARVKIPLTVAEDMLQALATNVTRFEEVAGRIRKPGEELPPSPELSG